MAVWHPNTQMSEWAGLPEVASAHGMWLRLSDGSRLLDGVASMWCNVWGHSEPRLVRALASQARVLQHAPLFNLTHRPAEELARGIVSFSPGMERVFYSDNGSSAVEVALKMALQHAQASGTGARRIASLENGYHGDTAGAMSAGFMPGFFARYRGLAFRAVRLPSPDGYRTPRSMTHADHAQRCLEKAEARLSRGDVAALVMESGAQVAGGARVYPPRFQRSLGRICRRNGVLLIVDEVATGLGRLGSMAEYHAQGCRPDIACYGKMLAGGYATIAATAATGRIYRAFLGAFGDKRHLFHGHTFTGNPLAAALAVENLAMYRERRLLRHVRGMASELARLAGGLRGIPLVGDVRCAGLLAGIELVRDRARKAPVEPPVSANRIIFEAGRRRGVYLRTLGSVVLLVPPLAMGPGDLRTLVERAGGAISDAAPALLGRVDARRYLRGRG